ncbi:MAG: 4-alpha-glucanotransferase [Spirochaetia bacterium]
MEFGDLKRYYTGVLVPLGSLRSARSSGVGEFADLPLLADWCLEAGLDVIQVLPVNDTGRDPSPYSAGSAFALHPLYLRLEDIPEVAEVRAEDEDIDGELTSMREELDEADRIPFEAVVERKYGVLQRVFAARTAEIRADARLSRWIEDNPWIREFAVYRSLKEQQGKRSWVDWNDLQTPSLADIEALWEKPSLQEELRFYCWIQYHAETQLRAAAEAVSERGVYLKGDLPILLAEDSADVWAHRDIFKTELRAGAPPDMFSHLGQNWGLPIYDWDVLASQNYDWWRRRLEQADAFYHAFRIDHVLGFFRIWAVSARDAAGTMGYFHPSYLLRTEELQEAGFDEGRIRWLAQPHISGERLREVLADDADWVIERCLSPMGDEDLYVFAEDVGERDLLALELPHDARETLRGWYHDRALIPVASGRFAPAWKLDVASAYRSLEDEEKQRLDALVSHAQKISEEMWEEQGRRILSLVNGSAAMLPCAEDLGVVPESVPRVLSELEILGLRIPRWTRRWDEPGEPYVPLERYPYLTVCAPSVHDTTTLREWWEREDGIDEFWEQMGFEGERPAELTPEVAERVIARILQTNSAICMFQIQDFFALSDDLRASDPGDERINVPGTTAETNWSYRLPVNIEQLIDDTALNARISSLLEQRRVAVPNTELSES